MTTLLEEIAAEIKSHRTGVKSLIALGELSLEVPLVQLEGFCHYLRDTPRLRFTQLIDICGVDYLGRTPRFDLVYHFLSMDHNMRLRLKVGVEETDLVPSLSYLFKAAGWFEREAWDMYGICFKNHPDLRRLLTDYTFEGHPLRKDFPLTGFEEVYYDESQNRVAYKPVELMQEYRFFERESPWQGMDEGLQGEPESLLGKILKNKDAVGE